MGEGEKGQAEAEGLGGREALLIVREYMASRYFELPIGRRAHVQSTVAVQGASYTAG